MTPGLRNKTRWGAVSPVPVRSPISQKDTAISTAETRAPAPSRGTNSLGSESPVARRPRLESPASEIRSLPLVATWVRLPRPPTTGPLDPARHQATDASREARGGPSLTCRSRPWPPGALDRPVTHSPRSRLPGGAVLGPVPHPHPLAGSLKASGL